MIERESIARYNAGFFITRNLDIILQNYAKVKLNKNYTVPEILSQLKLIRRVQTRDGYFLTEISKTQRFILEKLKIPLPT